MPNPANGFTACSPLFARLWLFATAAVVAFFVWVTLSPLKSGFADGPPRGSSDVQLYLAIGERIQSGDTFYFATNEELRQRGYPTGSVLNWRLPTLAWLLAFLANGVLRSALLAGLALLALIWAFELIRRERGTRDACFVAAFLLGALLPCILGDLYVMHEVWAGVLILLSVLALARKQTAWGVLFGIAAMAIRELAAPYASLCFVYALVHRRWREAGGWFIGSALCSLLYFWHWEQSQHWIREGDIVHAEGWVRFGGAAFVISTVQMNIFLLLSPQWVSAIYFPLALLGFASWRTKRGEPIGLSVAMFALLFAVVGMPINQYWGSMTAPLFCLGAAQAPRAIRELWTAAQWRREDATNPLVA